MLARAGTAANHLRTGTGAVMVAALVAVASGFTVAATGGWVVPWFLGIAALLLATWFLTVVLLAKTPDDTPRLLRRSAICLAPLAVLNLDAVTLAGMLPKSLVTLVSTAGVSASLALATGLWVLPRITDGPTLLGAVFRSRWTVWAMVAAWAVVFGARTVLQWHNFAQYSQDMAIHEQAVYNTLHGRFLSYSCDIRHSGVMMSRIADHFEPIILLFVPLYALWQSPVWFMLAQVVGLAAGALAIARLARRWYGGAAAGLVFAGIYLTHPGIIEALHSDVHMGTLSAGLLLWGFVLGLERRTIPSVICFVLAMACKENIPVTVAMMGLYLAWRGQRRYGLFLTALGGAWSVAAIVLIIPACSPTGRWFYTDSLLHLHEIVAMREPWLWVTMRLNYLSEMMAGVGGLCVLSPSALIVAAPELVANCLGRSDWMHNLVSAYHVTAVPGIMVAGIAGLVTLRRWIERAGKSGLDPRVVSRALLIFLALMAVGAAWQEQARLLHFRCYPAGLAEADLARLHALVGKVPDDAAVLVNDAGLASHLARRPMLLFHFKPEYADAEVMRGYEEMDYVFLRAPLTPPQERRFGERYGLQLVGHVKDRWLWRVPDAVSDRAEREPAAPRSG